MNMYLKRFFLIGLFLLVSLGIAYGSSWHRLAYSKKQGAEVFAALSGENWCKDTIETKIKLTSTSPLLNDGMEPFLNKVVSILKKDCSTTKSIQLKIFNGENKAPISDYTASAKNNWNIQTLSPAAKSIDDIPDSSQIKKLSSPMKPQKIKSVKINYLSLLPVVMPDPNAFLTKSAAMTDYLAIRHCKEYARTDNNEIKIAKLASEYKSEAQAFFDSAPPEFLNIEFEEDLGKYDFDRGAFVFSPLKEDTTFRFRRPNKWQCRTTSELYPSEIILNIEGGELAQEFPAPEKKAENAIKGLYHRRVLVSVTVKIINWNKYSIGTQEASVDTMLHSIKIVNPKTGRMISEIPNDLIEPKIAERIIQKEKEKALRRQKEKEELARKEKEKARQKLEEQAKKDRIARGVEPLDTDGKVVFAHFKKLSSSDSDSHLIDAIDTRRPLRISVQTHYDKEKNIIQFSNGLFSLSDPQTEKELSFSFQKEGKAIKLIIQNGEDFLSQQAPGDIKTSILKARERMLKSKTIFIAKPVGVFDDPFKGGKAVIVHAQSAEFELSSMWGKNRTWSWVANAKTTSKPYIQKKDIRTARELDIAGLHGGMELEDVQDILDDKLQLKTIFNENLKSLTSHDKISTIETILKTNFQPGQRFFEGAFVQTGKSLMGLGSPIYSLKQCVLAQTASAKEKDVIIQGLLDKFGEPDLKSNAFGLMVLSWGKRITNDRSDMLAGNGLKRPVSAIEAQVYHSDAGVLTILILTDELYLQKTKVTTKTVY